MGEDSIIARLKVLDSESVSDAMDSEGREGVVTGIAPLSPGWRIVGRAVTVGLRRALGEHSVKHLGASAIEISGSGDVVVVAHPGPLDVAGWGGNLHRALAMRGAAGVIVDGACRDAEEIRASGFPAFVRSVTPRTARGRVVQDSLNEPVIVGGITVSAGDYVIADGSGLVFINKSFAAKVIRIAERIKRDENALAKRLAAGDAVGTVMGAKYEQAMRRQEPAESHEAS